MVHENLIDLTEAAKCVPSMPHPATIWRWCRKGVLARSGARIKLPHRRIGARIYLDPADLDRFFIAVAESDARHFDAAPTPDPPKQPETNGHAGRRAHTEATLRRAGIV